MRETYGQEATDRELGQCPLPVMYPWSAEHGFSLAQRARRALSSLLSQKKLLRSIKANRILDQERVGSAQFWQLLPLEANFHQLRDN